MDALKIILDFFSQILMTGIIVYACYKFAIKHESYEIEFGWFMKPKKINGKLKEKDKEEYIEQSKIS